MKSGFTCQVSCVRCHMSRVTCHPSHVNCNMSITPTATATDPSPANQYAQQDAAAAFDLDQSPKDNFLFTANFVLFLTQKGPLQLQKLDQSLAGEVVFIRGISSRNQLMQSQNTQKYRQFSLVYPQKSPLPISPSIILCVRSPTGCYSLWASAAKTTSPARL